jgi:NAD(P)-dependent dehydrogenase (short-subunit alcohol dehydrogenase family)
MAQAGDFGGRVVIVTGAGSGMGRVMAHDFARAGAEVLVNDIIAERAHAVVAEIMAAGGSAVAAVADISDEVAVEAFVGDAIARWGKIDVLCNNAGIMDRLDLPENTSTEMWNRIMAVNVTGYFFVTRAVLPHMLARKTGAIVNTASAAGLRGGTAGLAYVASKHAVVGLTRNIAWMHQHDGIRCNAICPGAIETGILNGQSVDEAFDPAGFGRALPMMALGRMAGPDAIANLAVFLASDAAHFINGAAIPVDGGVCAA